MRTAKQMVGFLTVIMTLQNAGDAAPLRSSGPTSKGTGPIDLTHLVSAAPPPEAGSLPPWLLLGHATAANAPAGSGHSATPAASAVLLRCVPGDAPAGATAQRGGARHVCQGGKASGGERGNVADPEGTTVVHLASAPLPLARPDLLSACGSVVAIGSSIGAPRVALLCAEQHRGALHAISAGDCRLSDKCVAGGRCAIRVRSLRASVGAVSTRLHVHGGAGLCAASSCL